MTTTAVRRCEGAIYGLPDPGHRPCPSCYWVATVWRRQRVAVCHAKAATRAEAVQRAQATAEGQGGRR